jgi:DNA (cytosine-5)-methyltransferase 1
MKVAGLFSGIGGLELPFQQRGAHSALLCDVWDASRSVLASRFPGVALIDDVRTLDALPRGVDVVTAGFPCTDLSQAGRTAGIGGQASGLVAHVFRLLRHHELEWLVLENVRNMLVLDRGRAMSYLVSELEQLGFRWAYRLVDSRFTGVPQRRHRVILVASRHHDPRTVLFADDAEEPDASTFREDAFGFYWTEGLTGLGWARDAVPPLKGGSTVGIPSPPGVWIPSAPLGAKLITPGIDDAEALQGFERGWTIPAMMDRKNGPRWKLVGNAVTVGVAQWLVARLYSPGPVVVPSREVFSLTRWPNAAYGEAGRIQIFDAGCWPLRREYRHLLDVLTPESTPLSHRAAAGFLARASRSRLKFRPDFLADLEEHVRFMRGDATPGSTQTRSRRHEGERAPHAMD